MVRVAFMAWFFFPVAGLFTVGLVSWSRTGELRRGMTRRPPRPPAGASFRSSRTTLLAAQAGVAAVAWGASAWSAHRMEAVPLVAAGMFVAVTGSVARVIGIRADDDGLVVLLARRPSFRAGWPELFTLRPPAFPLGGWRLTDVHGARSTLMPSDLLGHEALLETIVARADLRFDGRMWRRDPPDGREETGSLGVSLRKP